MVMTENLREEQTIVRKIDRNLLPLMFGAFVLQFLDKTALGYAALLDIETALLMSKQKINGTQYSWTSSAFYFGYLIASYPVSLCFIRFPLAKTLSISFLAWGLVLACHAATSNFAGLMVLRVMLGILESTMSPGFSLMTSMWYRRSEHAVRHSFWFAGNCVGSIFGALIAFGITHLHDTLAPWKWIFVIFGLITLLYGIAFFIFLPDSPLHARFLSEWERNFAFERTRLELHTAHNHPWSKSQAIEAILDVKSWLLFVYTITSSIPNSGLTSFGGLVVKGFGFSTTGTLLVTIPAYVFPLIWLALSTWATAKLPKSRCYSIAFLQLVSIAGCLMVAEVGTDRTWTRLAGIWLFGAFSAGFPLALSLIASNVTGLTKKTTVSAMVFLGYCIGNIMGPLFFFADEAPTYQSAWLAIMISLGLAFVSMVGMHLWLRYKNRNRGVHRIHEHELGIQATAVLALNETDFEDKSFLYIL
ncbi:putative vitamin H transporter [Xylariales sp. PMI_506]|nr:putative vitamin H transporter [Xylariales sp. PMI_506]